MTDRNAPSKVVVIGGGYAGTMVANSRRHRHQLDQFSGPKLLEAAGKPSL